MKALQLGSLSFVLVVLGAGCSTTPPPYSGPTAEPVDGPSAEPTAPREPRTPASGGSFHTTETAAPVDDLSSSSSSVGEGFLRLAGGSGGMALLDGSGDSNLDLGFEAWVEMGKLLSDRFEVGVQAQMALGFGPFRGSVDPGLYGRLYFGDLNEGITPWIRGDLSINNLIAWGPTDRNSELGAILSLGATTFITDGVALEMSTPVMVIRDDANGDSEFVIPVIDDDQILLLFGLAFFW